MIRSGILIKRLIYGAAHFSQLQLCLLLFSSLLSVGCAGSENSSKIKITPLFEYAPEDLQRKYSFPIEREYLKRDFLNYVGRVELGDSNLSVIENMGFPDLALSSVSHYGDKELSTITYVYIFRQEKPNLTAHPGDSSVSFYFDAESELIWIRASGGNELKSLGHSPEQRGTYFTYGPGP